MYFPVVACPTISQAFRVQAIKIRMQKNGTCRDPAFKQENTAEIPLRFDGVVGKVSFLAAHVDMSREKEIARGI